MRDQIRKGDNASRSCSVPVDPIAFAGHHAYLTSGYAGVVETVDSATGRVVRRARLPYDSFEVATGQGYVVPSSLPRARSP